MKNIKVLGIDIAKHVFYLHGADARGRVVFTKKLSRNKLVSFVKELPRCQIAMEACGSSNHWGRVFNDLGFETRLIPAQYVRPYVKSHKNDWVDAEARVQAVGLANPVCKRLQKIDGIGPVTATALVAAIGDGTQFKNGRQCAAWLGLVPKQWSSGGKPRLGRMSKRGNCHLRAILVQGAKCVVRYSKGKTDRRHAWVRALAERKGSNKTAVAVANKNVRTAWAILTKGKEFDRDFVPEYLAQAA